MIKIKSARNPDKVQKPERFQKNLQNPEHLATLISNEKERRKKESYETTTTIKTDHIHVIISFFLLFII
jgi:uncharacterized membrane protein